MFFDSEVVECRSLVVTAAGFPIVKSTAWCTPGKKDSGYVETSVETNELTEDAEDDGSNYIVRNDGNGIITTLHVPTTIFALTDKVKVLEQERTMSIGGFLWHLIKR